MPSHRARHVSFALAVALLVVVSGCSAFTGQSNPTPTTTDEPTTMTPATTPTSGWSPQPHPNHADPQTDTIGWESGYWYDEPIRVNQSQGLTDEELDAYVARGMARVEYLRHAEFSEDVEVTVKSREEYQTDNPFGAGTPRNHSRWNNQVWEALFIVPGNENVSSEFSAVTDSAVLGYYSPGSDSLVIVSDSPSQPVINNATLIHELTHALQDQRFDLTKPKYNPTTQDSQLANNGLIEGEANYIQHRYTEYCANATWSCIRTPDSGSPPPGGNVGVQLAMYQPYNDGPGYIAHLVETGGWAAVDRAFETPPERSSRIIHPTQSPESHEFESLPRAESGWERFAGIGDGGADSVGEASLFVMMWYQNYKYGIDTIPRSSISSGGDAAFSYNHEVSAGLVADELVPHRNGSGEYGYVWRQHWRSASDAQQFRTAYERLLAGHGARHVQENVWVIENGGYAGAYYVHQDGADLTIVNAPTTSDLSNVYPTMDGGGSTAPDLPDLRTSVTVGAVVAGVLGLLLLANS